LGSKEEIKNVLEEGVAEKLLEVERNKEEEVLEKVLGLQAVMKIRKIQKMKIEANTKFASFIFMNFLQFLKTHHL
jgi:hypothetical protein